jgi:hypothetical protein
VAARAHVLAFDTDINAIYYRDFLRSRNDHALTASRFLGGRLEVHAEALGRAGASDVSQYPVIAPACGPGPQPWTHAFTASTVAGGRYTFTDNTIVSFEYLFQGDGLSAANYDGLRAQLPCLRAALQAMPPIPPAHELGYPVDPVVAFLRQHYLFASFTRPRLTKEPLADVVVGAAVGLGPVDQSVMVSANIGYNFAGRALLTLRGMYVGGPSRSEFASQPTRYGGMLDVRIGY